MKKSIKLGFKYLFFLISAIVITFFCGFLVENIGTLSFPRILELFALSVPPFFPVILVATVVFCGSTTTYEKDGALGTFLPVSMLSLLSVCAHFFFYSRIPIPMTPESLVLPSEGVFGTLWKTFGQDARFMADSLALKASAAFEPAVILQASCFYLLLTALFLFTFSIRWKLNAALWGILLGRASLFLAAFGDRHEFLDLFRATPLMGNPFLAAIPLACMALAIFAASIPLLLRKER